MTTPLVLTINGGSSSIKLGLYTMEIEPKNILAGKITNIGSGKTEMSITENGQQRNETLPKQSIDFHEAGTYLTEWLEKLPVFVDVRCIGHRIVHGMQTTRPTVVDDDLLAKLDAINQYDPDHLPAEIEMMRLFKTRFSSLLQVASFDTEFHTTLPLQAKLLPIPRRFYEAGVQRYGFHGLSYTYLMEVLEKKLGRDAAKGRIVLAHLGSGASMAAVIHGKSVDTSMGFTPTGGLPMSTRSGDIDPSLGWVIMEKEGMSPKQFNHFINHDCGLIGISETTGNMQQLITQATENSKAADAVSIFCYQAKKWIGAFTAALGGLDILVFAGGIGENIPLIRSGICEGLDYLGIDLDESENKQNAYLISSNKSSVKVLVIPTNEEIIIAQNTIQTFINQSKKI